MSESSVNYIEELFLALQKTRVIGADGVSLSVDDGMPLLVESLMNVKQQSKKVMVIGNGGSASIATHLHNDMSKALGIKAMLFYDVPLLTAYSNDVSYDFAFEEGVRQWSEADDLLVAISSSGRSDNILRAVAMAKSHGCKVITFSGFLPDNPLKEKGTLNIYTPSESYGYVETVHAIVSHYMTDVCKERLAKSGG